MELKWKAAAAAALFLCLSSAKGLVHAGDPQNLWNNGLTHGQALIAPSISAGLLCGFFIVQSVIDYTPISNSSYWVDNVLLDSIHLPLYFFNPLQGLAFSGAHGLITLTTYQMYEGNWGFGFFDDFISTANFQAASYSAYAVYRESRLSARPGEFNDAWRETSLGKLLYDEYDRLLNRPGLSSKWVPYQFPDLVIAPFATENLTDFFIMVFPVAGILNPLITRSHTNAIWTTGRCFIGTNEINGFIAVPAMALFFFAESLAVAIAEDAYFRGVIYEETGTLFGDLTAKIVDCVYFPAIHIPQDITLAHYDGWNASLNFLRRAVLTFYIDMLYDRGGLMKTVAAHFWIDFPQLMTRWLMAAGAPQSGAESILDFIGPVQLAWQAPF